MPEKREKILFTAGIFLMMFTAAVCTTTQGVLLTNYINYYHLKSFEQGLISAFQSGGNLAALFLIGLLLGRMRKNHILMISAVVIPLVFLGFGFKPPFYMLLLGYGLYGVAFGFMDSLASSVMVDLYRENSSRYMNLLHGIYGLGGLAGPVILRIFDVRQMSWEKILWTMGGFALLTSCIYAAGSLTAKHLLANEIVDKRVHIKDITDFLKAKKKQILFFSAFLYGAHQIGITVWMTRYISEYLKTPEWGALALSVFWICVALSRLIVPGFRWNSLKVIWLGHLISGSAVFIGVVVGNGILMTICVGITGLAEGTILPLTLDMACHWEKENTSLGSTMVLLAHYAGFIVAPMVMGALIERFFSSAGMMLPVLLSFGAAILIRVIQKGEAHRENTA